MSKTRPDPPTTRKFRTTVLVFASVLGVIAIWILVAECLRPTIELTTDAKYAASICARRDAALEAARVGIVRGDLWSDVAVAYGCMLWTQDGNASGPDVTSFENTQAATELAISLAPHDSRLWLLLAANYFRFNWLDERATAALKMSYYTGLNTIAILPERLFLAAQSPALKDEDFQELVRHDVHVTLDHRSELMPALVAAYRSAPLVGRQFLEKSLTELDPSAVATVRSEVESR